MPTPSSRHLLLSFLFLSTIASCQREPPGGSGRAEDGGIDDDGGGLGGPGCGLVTCASADATCGPVGDGCGGVIDCGTSSGTDMGAGCVRVGG